MRFDRPPPGEEINEGPVTEPRQAATLMLLRDGADGPEVLLVQRNPISGSWAAPGSSPAAPPTPRMASLAAAAVREMEEEAAVTVALDSLVPFSRWITPAEVKVRFDTWFFVAATPDGAEPRVDGQECVDVRWISPSDALDAGRRDEMLLVFPTIKHLEHLDHFGSVAATLADADGRSVDAVQPRIVLRDGLPEVLLPGEPGYEEACVRPWSQLATAALTVAVTGPTGDLGISIVNALERSRAVEAHRGHGPPPVRPRRAAAGGRPSTGRAT